MTFGVPLFLIATLAAAIPVVLHLISHQQAKQLPFSTLRFLQVSVEKTRRRRRVHDASLMLLRAAVLALIALGLARPTLTGLRSLLGGADSAAVIVLDNSASMGVVDRDRPCFQTAVAAATQVLDELGEGDEVALLVTGGPAFPETEKLSRTQDKVRQVLNQVQPSAERADLGGRIEQARELFKKSDASNRQIFVLSDMQNLSWDGLKEQVGQEASDGKKPELSIVLVDCSRAPKPNVAVTDVALESAVPVAGMPIEATVEVFNASPVVQQRHVELYVDGVREAGSPILNVPAEGRLRCDFSFVPKRSGLHRGEARLVGEDGSPLDDRRFFTIEVGQGIAVAVVKAARHEIPYLEDTFYVERALAPVGASGWAIQAKNLSAAELPTESLAPYKVVYLVNVPAPDEDTAERLRTYVASGGHLVWICGDNIEPEAYNRADQQAKGELLPAPLTDLRAAGAAEGRDSWAISTLDKDNRALGALVEPASLYQSVLVYKYVRLDTAKTPGLQVLGRLEGGDPILVERRVGQGSVMMLTTGAHVAWTNLPLRPIFLPLLLRLTFELLGAEHTRDAVLAGAPLTLPLESPRPTGVEVQPPSGALVRLPVDERSGNSFRFADTHQMGIYLVRLLKPGATEEVAFSVNVDAEEADAKKIEREELQTRFGTMPLVWAEDPDDLAGTFRLMREGKGLWDIFLWAVLIVLVGEGFFANRLGLGGKTVNR
jgi:hypothetical protein